MKNKKFYIKERYNPQLGFYYVACGQMTKSAAASVEKKCVYGSNTMYSYKTEAEYKECLEKLRRNGKRVHE